MLKRLMGRALVAFAIAGLGVLGLSAPASATTTSVTYEDFCAGVKITVSGVATIEVPPNDVTIGTSNNSVSYWGAIDGDEFEVVGFQGSHIYEAPEGCSFPFVEFH